MPPPLNLPPDEYQAHMKRKARERQARHRAGHVTRAQIGSVTPDARNVTPASLPARTQARSPGLDVSTKKNTPTPAPKPNRSADVIDALRAAGLPDVLTKADHQAVKASPLSPAQLVEAFGAAFRGEWGGEWLRDNLSLQAVVKRYPGYLAWKQRPKGATRTGMLVNGVHVPASAFQRNLERTYRAPEDYSEAQLAASDAERERVMAALPERLRGKSRWRAG